MFLRLGQGQLQHTTAIPHTTPHQNCLHDTMSHESAYWSRAHLRRDFNAKVEDLHDDVGPNQHIFAPQCPIMKRIAGHFFPKDCLWHAWPWHFLLSGSAPGMAKTSVCLSFSAWHLFLLFISLSLSQKDSPSFPSRGSKNRKHCSSRYFFS